MMGGIRRGLAGRSLVLLATTAAWTLAACGKKADHTATAESVDNGAVATTPAGAAEVTSATLTVADLNLYAQMMRNRIDSQRTAMDHLSHAATAKDTMDAVRGRAIEGPDSVTAHTAGVTVQHLRAVAKIVEDFLGNEQMAGRMADFGSQTDTAQMSAADRARVGQLVAQSQHTADSMRANATAGMSPAVAAALEQRRLALDSLGTELMEAGTPVHS
jgi:hypothetical protein